MKKVSHFLIAILLTTCFSCDSENSSIISTGQDNGENENYDNPYPVSVLHDLSEINKLTSWYQTNSSFNELFNVRKSKYWGFEITPNSLIPYNHSTTHTWSEGKDYYWYANGVYIYTDLTGNDRKDLWSFYHRHPWPTNKKGLHLFSNYDVDPNNRHIEIGLSGVRKVEVSDLNNDGNPELVLFSHGYDDFPHPGDSLAIFYPQEKKYTYLSDAIGFFHGGAVGDVTNNGYMDIIAYSGGGQEKIRPVAYLNDNGKDFNFSEELFSGFTDEDNFYTVELFDLSNDGKLELILGGYEKLLVVPQQNGIFHRSSGLELPITSTLNPLDFNFLDLNQNGYQDLIVNSVGNDQSGYTGFEIDVYINNGENFERKTEDYITGTKGLNEWIMWLRLFDFTGDGNVDIVASGVTPPEISSDPNTLSSTYVWSFRNGKFERNRMTF